MHYLCTMRKLLFVCIILICQSAAHAQDYCNSARFDQFVFDSLDVERIKDVPYGQAINQLGNLQNLTLDVYLPSPSVDTMSKRPCVFFVHGGGLVGGSKESEGALQLGYLYAMMGYVYVSIDYRTGWNNGDDETGCGGDTIDLMRATYRALQDVKAAYRYIKNKASVYDIDTNYIFVEGNSAGSRQLIYAAYAEQDDFDPMFYAELGSIDTAVNDLTNFGFDPKGIITEALGIEDSLLLLRKEIPHLLIHGTCDSIVAFFSGPTFFCFEPFVYPYLQGSYVLADMLESVERKYQFYIGEGAGHDAAIPDTLVTYGSAFMKSILCNTLSTERFYRVLGKFKCAVANEGELVITELYPNPVEDIIYLEVTSTRIRAIDLQVYNVVGQTLISEELEFFPPLANYTVDVSGLPRGIYFMRLSQRQEEYILKFFKL